jgi:hypothetical protein
VLSVSPAARGFTLAELVVALGLTGVAFGAFAMVVARQERTHAELSRRVRQRSQSSEGLAALAAELRAVAPGAGDVPTGGARDSAIEFRTTVGSLAVCERRGQTIVGANASFASPPEPGDTAWAYIDADTGADWLALPIVDVSLLAIEQSVQCRAPPAASTPPPATPAPARRQAPRHRYALALSQPPPDGMPIGTPVRVTRQIRYSVYRAPDGQWYLGRREWSAVRGGFETIQPVSGPYGGFAALRYFDDTGSELSGDIAEPGRIGRIVVRLRESHDRLREVTSLTIGVRNR